MWVFSISEKRKKNAEMKTKLTFSVSNDNQIIRWIFQREFHFILLSICVVFYNFQQFCPSHCIYGEAKNLLDRNLQANRFSLAHTRRKRNGPSLVRRSLLKLPRCISFNWQVKSAHAVNLITEKNKNNEQFFTLSTRFVPILVPFYCHFMSFLPFLVFILDRIIYSLDARAIVERNFLLWLTAIFSLHNSRECVNSPSKK